MDDLHVVGRYVLPDNLNLVLRRILLVLGGHTDVLGCARRARVRVGMLKQCPCRPPMQPPAFVKATFKNCSTYAVGIWGLFATRSQEMNKLSLLQFVTGTFNSLISKKFPVLFEPWWAVAVAKYS